MGNQGQGGITTRSAIRSLETTQSDGPLAVVVSHPRSTQRAKTARRAVRGLVGSWQSHRHSTPSAMSHRYESKKSNQAQAIQTGTNATPAVGTDCRH